MFRTAIVLALLAGAGAAEAQRPYTPRLSCAQVQALIQARGSVVLSTSPTTYDRFVANNSFCDRTELLEPTAVQTADAPQCVAGFRCIDRNRYDFD